MDSQGKMTNLIGEMPSHMKKNDFIGLYEVYKVCTTYTLTASIGFKRTNYRQMLLLKCNWLICKGCQDKASSL